MVTTAKYFIPRLLGTFCSRYPEIDVSPEVINCDGVVARLRDNLDDLSIRSMPPAGMDLADEVFMPNPLVVIAAKTHSLARRRRLALADLADQRFILREHGSGTRMAVDRRFRCKRFRPDVRPELGSNEAIRESVAGGLGIAVLSSHALHGRAGGYGVSVLDVEGFPLRSQWHLVHPRAKRLSPIARVFKAHLLGGSPLATTERAPSKSRAGDVRSRLVSE